VSLLQATLEEEKDTDEKLSKLAVTPINQTAEAAE
jgi:ferritin-like metal-binding protein YciE